MDKVSIIMPVYNSEKYLKDTIESVIKQTYNRIELIIVDDASTDDSYNICKEMQNGDDRIILQRIENGGVSKARNLGLKLASGDYIMFIDSDDLYDEKIVEKMINSIENNDWGVCLFEKLDNKGKIHKKKIKENINIEKIDYFISFLQKNDLFNNVWNKIYKRDIILENNITFNEEISIAEDLEFNLKYIEKIKKITYVDEYLYTYRLSTNGLNYSYHKDRIEIRKKLYKYQKELFLKNNYDVSLITNEYIKICLAELKQLNWLKNNNQINIKIKEILRDKDRQKELQTIKKQGIIYKFLIFFLSNKFCLFFICKLIKVLKKL